mmetsp:Transcript_45116/g.109883  ORF Transcript_45116/g.109883 Transcript_45116/m.109883 type:complete len:126 (-) Transcript_45116:134-511(-)
MFWSENRAAAVQEAISKGLMQVNLEEQDSAGNTPLLLAADRGDVEAVELLLWAGASLHARNKEDQSCLHHSAACTVASASSATTPRARACCERRTSLVGPHCTWLHPTATWRRPSSCASGAGLLS